MSHVHDKIIQLIEEAIQSAKMKTAGFGFGDDRITIKRAHFGNQGFAVGTDVHPTEFIVKTTELYRGTWIVSPLEHALAIIKTQAELIERAEELRASLNSFNLDRIVTLAEKNPEHK